MCSSELAPRFCLGFHESSLFWEGPQAKCLVGFFISALICSARLRSIMFVPCRSLLHCPQSTWYISSFYCFEHVLPKCTSFFKPFARFDSFPSLVSLQAAQFLLFAFSFSSCSGHFRNVGRMFVRLLSMFERLIPPFVFEHFFFDFHCLLFSLSFYTLSV